MVDQRFTVYLAVEDRNGSVGSVYDEGDGFTGIKGECAEWLSAEAGARGHEDWLGVVQQDDGWGIVARPAANDSGDVLWDDEGSSY